MSQARIKGLYAITPDITDTHRLTIMVGAALTGGINILQYRNKSPDKSLRLLQATALLALCRTHNVPLIINDDVELALAIGADGVHLGTSDDNLAEARQKLGNQFLIGASCYGELLLAQRAVTEGADYVAFGSMFVSSTKPTAVKAPLTVLSEAKTALACPVVAIGGIRLDNIQQIAATGADAAAIITDLFDADSISRQAQKLRQAFSL